MPNEYDDERFFAEYANMTRSRQGLAGAGEWWQLKDMLPPLEGKCVLDLGCGYGWHCAYAAQHGAKRVLGIDISEKMLAQARQCNAHERITYRLCGISEYEYPLCEWDCVISNLALHYISDLDAVYAGVYATLRPGGMFIFNIEHPAFTSGVGQDWAYADDGRPLYWPIDDYFRPGARVTRFLGCEVVKQHHTLTQILMGLLRRGFSIEAVQEAEPSPDQLDQPGMRDELRRPMMLMVRARADK